MSPLEAQLAFVVDPRGRARVHARRFRGRSAADAYNRHLLRPQETRVVGWVSPNSDAFQFCLKGMAQCVYLVDVCFSGRVPEAACVAGDIILQNHLRL